MTTSRILPQASLSVTATTITCRLLPLELIITIPGPFIPVIFIVDFLTIV